MAASAKARFSKAKDVGALLVEQLETLCGPGCLAKLCRERPWASITFSGARHSVELEWHDDRQAAQVKQLESLLHNHEFDLPGHFVADLLVKNLGNPMTIDILTIIDPIAERRA